MAEKRYSISQAGRLVGVENHVLRYWEDELHLEIPRDRKNQRYYTKLHIEMFQKINELKEKGYQLKAIEPVLKRMLTGEKELDLNEVLRQNAAEILRQARAAGQRAAEAEQDALSSGQNMGMPDSGRSIEKPGKQRSDRKQLVGNCSEERGASATVLLDPEHVYEYANMDEAQTGTQTESSRNEESVEMDMDGEAKESALAMMENERAVVAQQEKLEQFQQLMNHIISNAIGQAMRQNNEALSEEISRQVNDRMVQELEYMMRISDEKEEERFKALDETLRAHQRENKGKAEAAAARMSFFRKKKFGRNGKKL